MITLPNTDAAVASVELIAMVCRRHVPSSAMIRLQKRGVTE
jgi:hypothetical protein